MPDHRRAVAAGRPVLAGLLGRGAVGQRAGQDVVPVRLISAAIDDSAGLVEGRLLVDGVRFAVQRVDARGDLDARGIDPRPGSDPVAGVLGARREIGAPCLAADPGRLGEACTMGVGSFDAAEIRALTRIGAGDEKLIEASCAAAAPARQATAVKARLASRFMMVLLDRCRSPSP